MTRNILAWFASNFITLRLLRDSNQVAVALEFIPAGEASETTTVLPA